MRYKIIDVYQKQSEKYYIARCLKEQSPQYLIIESPHTLCLNLDIIDVNHKNSLATWATGEQIALKILRSFDEYDVATLPQH